MLGSYTRVFTVFKVSRIEEMLEASRAGGPVRVGLCIDSAPINSTP